MLAKYFDRLPRGQLSLNRCLTWKMVVSDLHNLDWYWPRIAEVCYFTTDELLRDHDKFPGAFPWKTFWGMNPSINEDNIEVLIDHFWLRINWEELSLHRSLSWAYLIENIHLPWTLKGFMLKAPMNLFRALFDYRHLRTPLSSWPTLNSFQLETLKRLALGSWDSALLYIKPSMTWEFYCHYCEILGNKDVVWDRVMCRTYFPLSGVKPHIMRNPMILAMRKDVTYDVVQSTGLVTWRHYSYSFNLTLQDVTRLPKESWDMEVVAGNPAINPQEFIELYGFNPGILYNPRITEEIIDQYCTTPADWAMLAVNDFHKNLYFRDSKFEARKKIVSRELRSLLPYELCDIIADYSLWFIRSAWD